MLVLLVLSAAFDIIDHGSLLDRLAGLEFGGIVLKWFHSFLTDQTQTVKLGDTCLGASGIHWRGDLELGAINMQ